MSRLPVWMAVAAALMATSGQAAVTVPRTADSPAATSAKVALRNKQFTTALRDLCAAADRGDVQSEYLLGLMYATGAGTEVSSEEARRWLESSAAGGHADAALALAGLLAPSDRPAARKWVARAASEGHPLAIRLAAEGGVPMAPSREVRDGVVARELLLWSVRRRDEPAVAAFIKLPGAGEADEFGRSPLEHAVIGGSESILTLLLTAGADAQQADHFGVTALMLAAENANPRLLDALLGSGRQPLNSPDAAGDTALFYAARVGLTGQVQKLVAAGAALDAVNADGWTAVDVATRNSHADTAQALRKAGGSAHSKTAMARDASGVDPDRQGELYQGWPPLTIAVSRNDPQLVTVLLTAGARPDAPTPQRDTPLTVAVKYAAVDVIAPLLKAGADAAVADANGETPLGYAASHAQLPLLDALLQKGVSPETRARTEEPAIIRATRAHSEEAVAHLIEAGANVNARTPAGLTALLVAAAAPDPQIMRRLIVARARVDQFDGTGRDALWLAAQSGSEDAADQLLSAGAPVDADRRQLSPLFAAVRAGQAKMLEHLLRKGLSPNPLSPSGDTPLIAAAARGSAALVRVLVDGGAAVDAQNAAGNTALIVAIREGNSEACQVLLKAGANARLRNADRIDALDTARRRNLNAIVALLQAP